MHNRFTKHLLSFAAWSGITGVMIGAFGAHFLKSRLPETDLETLRTAVLYLFIHTLAIMGVSILHRSGVSVWLRRAGRMFVLGMLLFSGSLFIIATDTLTGFPSRYIGWVTPVGGLCFIAGWASLYLYSREIRD